MDRPRHRGRAWPAPCSTASVGAAVAQRSVRGPAREHHEHGARAFYEGYGFVGTGELEPLRPGSEQRIKLMRRTVWVPPDRLTAEMTAFSER